MSANGMNPDPPAEEHLSDPASAPLREYLDLVDQMVAAITDEELEARLQGLLGRQANDREAAAHEATQQSAEGGNSADGEKPERKATRSRAGERVRTRLLTNIGRLWTGSEVWSNAAILTHGDQIAWVGPASELPRSLPGVIDDIIDVDDVQNLNGGLVTPGLIDAHTHPVYAGNRWAEIAMRTGGSSPNEIAAAGGGIASTVMVTRGTDPWTLCHGVRNRLREWLLAGTTTIEAKTGYHLTKEGELADVRMLRSLENEPGMPRVHVTFLAAHARLRGRGGLLVRGCGRRRGRQRGRVLRGGPVHRA